MGFLRLIPIQIFGHLKNLIFRYIGRYIYFKAVKVKALLTS